MAQSADAAYRLLHCILMSEAFAKDWMCQDSSRVAVLDDQYRQGPVARVLVQEAVVQGHLGDVMCPANVRLVRRVLHPAVHTVPAPRAVRQMGALMPLALLVRGLARVAGSSRNSCFLWLGFQPLLGRSRPVGCCGLRRRGMRGQWHDALVPVVLIQVVDTRSGGDRRAYGCAHGPGRVKPRPGEALGASRAAEAGEVRLPWTTCQPSAPAPAGPGPISNSNT